MRKLIKRMVVAAVVLGVIGATLAWYLKRENGKAISFRTAQVTRGNLLVTIDASGTLEPEEVVDVGAQVAGQIVSFGADADGKTVDYGSRVEQGTVLARIDESLPQANVSEAQAQLQSAQAGVQLAEANLEQLKAKLSQAQRDWERAKKLGPSEALAQSSYDSYQSAYEVAKADVAVGEASILQAKASLAQAETSLWRAKRNLDYCTISSPVKGVIIDRRVNIGQTVVASLNAPSLFLIAKDLKRMQVWVAVNEADVARIYPGQPVTFTVDALPDETFRGEVVKVRLNASMTQNVVTYTVEIVTDNSAGRLLPYLTANVKFEVGRRENVLLVPGAALRWTPSVEQVAAEFRNGTAPKGEPTPPQETAPAATEPSEGGMRPGAVYAVAGRYVRPIPVWIGLSSGAYTEVEGEGLAEGLELVTGVEAASAGATEASNPFTPKLPAHRRGGGPPLG